ncbi:unnamed protein product [Symbiodinium sp. CCMP2456]|nr:unnamed protein product [Symbiodinium sp. CCMP2456]
MSKSLMLVLTISTLWSPASALRDGNAEEVQSRWSLDKFTARLDKDQAGLAELINGNEGAMCRFERDAGCFQALLKRVWPYKDWDVFWMDSLEKEKYFMVWADLKQHWTRAEFSDGSHRLFIFADPKFRKEA